MLDVSTVLRIDLQNAKKSHQMIDKKVFFIIVIKCNI